MPQKKSVNGGDGEPWGMVGGEKNGWDRAGTILANDSFFTYTHHRTGKGDCTIRENMHEKSFTRLWI